MESRGRRIAAGALCAILAGWALADLVRDRIARRPAAEFAHRFALDRRRPLEISAMRLAPWPDVAAAAAADAALDGPPDREASAEQKRLWQESQASRDAELEGARDLMLEAVARRPGWGPHRFVLGRTVRTLQRRPGGTDRAADWFVPIKLAGAAAPGMDPVYDYLSGAILESWPELGPEARAEAPALLRRAFLDVGPVASGFLAARVRLGSDAAVALLPDDAGPLAAASSALIRSGDIVAAAHLQPALRVAARRAREEDLRSIAQRRAAGDLSGARSLCETTYARFPPHDFDDAPGRAQSARLLALWPNDAGGVWRTDPRGELVRFFLERREGDARPDAMLAAVEALSAVPATAEARVRLLAGDMAGALELMRTSGTAASNEWVSFRLAAARAELARGNPGGARVLLGGLSSTAREGCDALLCRRDVARSLGDAADVAYAEERLRGMDRSEFPPEAWSETGSMTICAAAPGPRRLRIEIDAEKPALVRYGRDGGRSDVLLVPAGSGPVTLAFQASGGRQTISVSAEAGGPIRLGAASLEAGS